MNKDRRKKIDELISTLEAVKADIESLQSDEESAFDNLPESMQQGDKGQAMETAKDALQSAADEVDTITQHLEEARDV